MADYSNEIAALREAIASGAKTVSYEGKSVTYDDYEALIARLKWLEGQQVAGTPARRHTIGFASFSRGDR